MRITLTQISKGYDAEGNTAKHIITWRLDILRVFYFLQSLQENTAIVP
jgi:hypothetical protein